MQEEIYCHQSLGWHVWHGAQVVGGLIGCCANARANWIPVPLRIESFNSTARDGISRLVIAVV